MKKLLIFALIIFAATVAAISQTSVVAPINPTAQINNGVVYVEWQVSGPVTSFEITPIYVKGNTERRLAPATVYNRFALYSELQLKQDGTVFSGGTGPVKYRFAVKTINNTEVSPETKSNTITVK